MEKKDMLAQIADFYNINSNKAYAEFFGISEQSAFQQRNLGILKFEEIYNKCPDISPDWLLSRGTGPMLRVDRKGYEDASNPGGGAPVANGIASIQSYSKYYRKETTESVKQALDALSKEQENLSREQEHLRVAQGQITELIGLLKNSPDKG